MDQKNLSIDKNLFGQWLLGQKYLNFVTLLRKSCLFDSISGTGQLKWGQTRPNTKVFQMGQFILSLDKNLIGKLFLRQIYLYFITHLRKCCLFDIRSCTGQLNWAQGQIRAKNDAFSNGSKQFVYRQKLIWKRISMPKIHSFYYTFKKKLPF